MKNDPHPLASPDFIPIIISLEHRTDRQEKIFLKSRQDGFRAYWHRATHGARDLPHTPNPGAEACRQSHRDAIRSVRDHHPGKDVVIIEDDALIKCTPAQITEARREFPDPDILFLHRRKKWCLGAWGYHLKHESIDRYLAIIDSHGPHSGLLNHIDQATLRAAKSGQLTIHYHTSDLIDHPPRNPRTSDIRW